MRTSSGGGSNGMQKKDSVDQTQLGEKLAARTRTPAENFNMVIKKELADNFPAIKSIVPKHMTPERLARITLTAISRQPKLAECTPATIVGAVMNCATLGLEPNLIGHAYLVPFFNNKAGVMECQFQIGWKGQIDLIRRTGDVSKIWAETVYENDLFVYVKGEDKRMVHIPFDMLEMLDEPTPITAESSILDRMISMAFAKIKKRNPKDQGKAVRYYAAYRMKDGAYDFATMTAAQCLEHANRFSKSKFNGKLTGTWVDHFDAMCKKTCIKELSKYMPISIEIQEKLTTDEAVLKLKKGNGIESDDIFEADYSVVTEGEPLEETPVPSAAAESAAGAEVIDDIDEAIQRFQEGA